MTGLVPALAGLSGEGGGMHLAQGRITAWDSQTGAHTVVARGQTFTNLPMLNATEALTMKTGDVVLIAFQSDQAWIIGRVVTPGTPEFFSGAMPNVNIALTPVDTDQATQLFATGVGWQSRWAGAMIVTHAKLLLTAVFQISGATCTGGLRIRHYNVHPGNVTNPAWSGATTIQTWSGLTPADHYKYFDVEYVWPTPPSGVRNHLKYISIEVEKTGGAGLDWVAGFPVKALQRN